MILYLAYYEYLITDIPDQALIPTALQLTISKYSIPKKPKIKTNTHTVTSQY